MKNSELLLKKSALTVVEEEAKAVIELKKSIDSSFVNVVRLIAECKGRVVISGVGKSAIVAQKIVATLNSTGTPAIFMHAADAVHGDLGIVQKDDIVILVSKSGDTQEVKRLVPFIKKNGNTLVVMVANKNSYLAQHSDYLLYTPIEKEASPNNLAPTSSTTVQMVMGDAIAITLSKMKNFSPEDFASYHPGGSLGKRLYMTVSDVFDSSNRPSVSEDESIQNTIITISSHRLGATAVLDKDGKLMGIITDGDVRRMVETGQDIKTMKAFDIMTSHPKTIDIKELAIEAFNMMQHHKITSIVVLENDNYKGLIHIHDIIREGIG